MNILLKEILKNQRSVGEFIGHVNGIISNEDISDKAEQFQYAIDTLNKTEFSEKFWEAVLEYTKLKQDAK